MEHKSRQAGRANPREFSEVRLCTKTIIFCWCWHMHGLRTSQPQPPFSLPRDANRAGACASGSLFGGGDAFHAQKRHRRVGGKCSGRTRCFPLCLRYNMLSTVLRPPCRGGCFLSIPCLRGFFSSPSGLCCGFAGRDCYVRVRFVPRPCCVPAQ